MHNDEEGGSTADEEDSSIDVNDILGDMQAMSVNRQPSIGSLNTVDINYNNGDDDDVDIDTFKENCWEFISSAQKKGGISELATQIGQEEQDDGEANSIKVGVRTRPVNDREIRMGTRGCIEHLNDNRNLIVRKHNWNDEPYDMTFAFDHAFNEDSTQDEVFKAMGWTALRNAFSGYNVSIFAYGQTGSGKSHSMIGTESDPGLIRRIGEFLFDFIDRGSEELGYKYSTTVSAAEIYCENVRDLLVFMGPNGGPPGGAGGANKKKAPPKRVASLTSRILNSGASKAERMNREMNEPEQPTIQYDKNGQQMLKIREGKDGVYVEGQSKIAIRSMAEMGGIIFAAIENRMVRATNMNADSSRSHLIFVIEFSQTQISETTGRQSTVKSKINLIDLAGSERARSTGSSGEGLREGANINKSLSTLGRVISTLSEGKNRDHVPYRDSKLTYILKDSLGGDSKTAMLATISPSEVNYEETVSTLRYAASVKRIKTSASQHLEQEAGEMIEKLRAEVDALAQELKNQEIQAEALAEEHRIALEDLERSRPTKVVKDDREVAKLKAELGAMSKRAERYRSERDGAKKELESMEKRADRYRKERKVAEERVKQLEKDLAKAEKAAEKNSPQIKPTVIVERRLSPLPLEPPSPAPNAALTAENQRLTERVKELEALVSHNGGLGDDVSIAMKQRRETGTHLNRMSLELESTTLEKLKLEQKLKKKSEQMKDPLAVMSMGFSSMFGAALGSQEEEKDSDDEDEEHEIADDDMLLDDIAGRAILPSPDHEDGLESKTEVGGNNKSRSPARSEMSVASAAIAAAASSSPNVPTPARRRPSEAVSAGGGGVVVETLRHQLEDSNALNEALENKIKDQHIKMKNLSAALAELQENQAANDRKAAGDGEATAAMQRAQWEKANKEISSLETKLAEALAKQDHEVAVKKHLEARLKESEVIELSLRKAKDELMLAKDHAEDELRSLSARRAEDMRIATEKLEQAEQHTAKVEKAKAKLERELEKLQKRHSELRAASKRLLAEKMEKKNAAAVTPPPTEESPDGAPAPPPVPVERSKERPRSPRAQRESSATPSSSSSSSSSSTPSTKEEGRKSPTRARSPRATKERQSKELVKESSTSSSSSSSSSSSPPPPANASSPRLKSPARARSPRATTSAPGSTATPVTASKPNTPSTAPASTEVPVTDAPKPKPVSRSSSPRASRSPSTSTRVRPPSRTQGNNSLKVDSGKTIDLAAPVTTKASENDMPKKPTSTKPASTKASSSPPTSFKDDEPLSPLSPKTENDKNNENVSEEDAVALAAKKKAERAAKLREAKEKSAKLKLEKEAKAALLLAEASS